MNAATPTVRSTQASRHAGGHRISRRGNHRVVSDVDNVGTRTCMRAGKACMRSASLSRDTPNFPWRNHCAPDSGGARVGYVGMPRHANNSFIFHNKNKLLFPITFL